MTQVDTSESFEIIGAFVKAYKFQSCKGKLARRPAAHRACSVYWMNVEEVRVLPDLELIQRRDNHGIAHAVGVVGESRACGILSAPSNK